MAEMEILQVRMNKTLVRLVDSAVSSGMYPSRSEVLRGAVRGLFAPELKDDVLQEIIRRNKEMDKGEYVTLEELDKELKWNTK